MKKRKPKPSPDATWQDLAARILLAAEARPGPVAILVTSDAARSGTSTVAAALAAALARAGTRTALGTVGGAAALPEPGTVAIPKDGPARFDLPDRFEAYPPARRRPTEWVEGAEILILDAPAGDHFVTTFLAGITDYVVMVADAQHARLSELVAATARLTAAGGTVLGAVLNRYRSVIPAFLV